MFVSKTFLFYFLENKSLSCIPENASMRSVPYPGPTRGVGGQGKSPGPRDSWGPQALGQHFFKGNLESNKILVSRLEPTDIFLKETI
jgi:hypothetical protein